MEELERTDSVSQYGITWQFDAKVPVGKFVNGDYYVVGPVTVTSVTPKPLFGEEVSDPSADETASYAGQYARNGSALNLPVTGWPAFDSRTDGHRYDPKSFVFFPVSMKPGDSLISTISVAKLGERTRMLGPSDHQSVSSVQAAAVLTCLAQPVPADAFRPAYCDRSQRIYLARDLRRDLLPRLHRVSTTPSLAQYERVFQRPWLDTVFFEFCCPVENMPQYGREVARAAGIGTLLLCLDFTPEEKEVLLRNVVQVGIDYGGAVRAGHAGWPAHGGHGSGRKWIMVFAGILLGDPDMQNPYARHPDVKFGEDMQTMYGQGWTGAWALYAGHIGPDGEKQQEGWGAYEHLPPSQWKSRLGESYRRCCTSVAWVGEGLAIRILCADKIWNGNAFLDYCDRWMQEDDTPFLEEVKNAKGWDFSGSPRQRRTWDPFVDEMWATYRPTLDAPMDGWKQPPQGR
jgi:hypothetical protein